MILNNELFFMILENMEKLIMDFLYELMLLVYLFIRMIFMMIEGLCLLLRIIMKIM